MPIVLPEDLPAVGVLREEGVEVVSSDQVPSDRPLRIAVVNLMPNKPATETQIARLLGTALVPVELVLCVPDSYRPKNTSADHMAAFYRSWTRLRDEPFDGLIVTGAPVETLPFEQVAYWTDLCAIFDWARSLSLHSFYICWAAQAALHYQHAIPKHNLPEKAFGVFRHRLNEMDSNLLRGFGNDFPVPVSRHTEVRMADLPERSGLKVLAASDETGLCLIEDSSNRAVYMFYHIEYDTYTLADEFLRDRQAGKPVRIPCNYFPENDPKRPPQNVWRSYGQLLFANWLGGIEGNRLQVRREVPFGWTLGALTCPAAA
jgi:homoserine O-succinyltransferase